MNTITIINFIIAFIINTFVIALIIYFLFINQFIISPILMQLIKVLSMMASIINYYNLFINFINKSCVIKIFAKFL